MKPGSLLRMSTTSFVSRTVTLDSLTAQVTKDPLAHPPSPRFLALLFSPEQRTIERDLGQMGSGGSDSDLTQHGNQSQGGSSWTSRKRVNRSRISKRTFRL